MAVYYHDAPCQRYHFMRRRHFALFADAVIYADYAIISRHFIDFNIIDVNFSIITPRLSCCRRRRYIIR